MAKDNKIFRQAALERLEMPDELDIAMEVTTAKAWFAYFGCLIVIIAALIWSLYGTIPEKVMGTGILIKTGGAIVSINATSQGQLIDIKVQIGKKIEEGDIIAKISQPQLENELESAITRDKQLEIQIKRKKRDLSARKNWLNERYKKQRNLYRKGLITKPVMQQTLDEKNQAKQEISALNLQLKDSDRAIELLKDKLELHSKIISTQSGIVLEVRSVIGDMVQPGTPIINLEREQSEEDKKKEQIEAIIYMETSLGQRVQKDMIAHISPKTIKKEEHGYMIGKVTSVSQFPVTQEGMMRVLSNQQLVSKLLTDSQGPPIAVKANLIKDSTTFSGYKWSTKEGPSIIIRAGTMCVMEVVVKKQKPISYLIPFLKEYFGGG